MPLLTISLAFLAGMIVGSMLNLPAWGWILAALLALGFTLVERRSRSVGFRLEGLRRWLRLPVGLVLVFLFLGGLRWQLSQTVWTPRDLAFYNDSGKVELTAWVADYPDQRENTVQLRVRVESIQLEDSTLAAVNGDALVRLPPGSSWLYGDRLSLRGTLATPPEDTDFSYKDYLARQNIHSYLAYPAVRPLGSGAGSPVMAFIFRLRERAYQTLNRIFPQPEAALLAGVLLGLDRGLPDEIVTAFQDTGTAHIVAISGFNMSILAALLIGLLGRFLPRGWSALAAAAAIFFYTLLVGANPAVVRAAIMSSLALFGRLIGRSSSGTTPLAFSAALMCLANPMLPWDVSFQLSFTATLGLILFGEPLQRTFESWAENRWGEVAARKLTGPVSEYFLFTLAAQVTTLPVVLYHFKRLSLSAILANPLILPVQPGVMQLGGIALIAGMITPALGQVLAWLAWPLAAYTLRMVDLLAGIPFGAVSLSNFPLWMVILFYSLLFGVTFGWKKLTALRELIKPGLIFTSLGLITLLVWSAVLRRPDGKLHLILLDAPDSQIVLLRMPAGQRVLVGGGTDANLMNSDLGRWTGPLDRTLDAIVINSASADSLTGLPAMIERFSVRQAYWAVAPPDKRAAVLVSQTLRDGRIPVEQLNRGAQLRLDERVTLSSLARDEDYAALQLEYGNLCVIWPGDFSPEKLKQAGLRLNGCLLLVDEKMDTAAWAGLNPFQFVFIGEPSVTMPGALSTAAYGQIELISDGDGLWIEAEKTP